MTTTTIKTLTDATQQRIDSDNRLERKWRKQRKQTGMTMAQAQMAAAQMGSDVGVLCRNGKPAFYRVDAEGNVQMI